MYMLTYAAVCIEAEFNKNDTYVIIYKVDIFPQNLSVHLHSEIHAYVLEVLLPFLEQANTRHDGPQKASNTVRRAFVRSFVHFEWVRRAALTHTHILTHSLTHTVSVCVCVCVLCLLSILSLSLSFCVWVCEYVCVSERASVVGRANDRRSGGQWLSPSHGLFLCAQTSFLGCKLHAELATTRLLHSASRCRIILYSSTWRGMAWRST